MGLCGESHTLPLYYTSSSVRYGFTFTPLQQNMSTSNFKIFQCRVQHNPCHQERTQGNGVRSPIAQCVDESG